MIKTFLGSWNLNDIILMIYGQGNLQGCLKKTDKTISKNRHISSKLSNLAIRFYIFQMIGYKHKKKISKGF